MPTPSYRAWLGFSKDTVNTTLSAAVAASAVTVPIVGTGVAANSTITIIDGPLTESRAVTAGGGTSSLTVAALTNAHSAGAYVTAQLTASLGAVDYLPCMFTPTDTQAQLKDKGYRGSAAIEFGNVAGVRSFSGTITGDVFPDTFGYLVGGVTGAVDFAGGTPNVHTFALKNTGDTQPTPFVGWMFIPSEAQARVMAGLKVEELTINYDPSALLTYSAKVQSWASGVGPAPAGTAPTYSSVTPGYSWGVQASIGGSNVAYVSKATITIRRPATPVFTLQNLPDPYKIWSGPQDVSGSLEMVFEDATQYNNFMNNSQPATKLTFTPAGANPNVITVQMTKCNFETFGHVLNDASGYVKANLNFRALANTTDANTAGTGYAPVRVAVSNSKASGSFQ